MKIKKSFLAILAVLTLFAASASTSVSAFTSVEANAATHHKDTKKHKKAKKSSKKHKKATKKSKKKATKKHSKKKVAKKKKKVTKKKPAKKAVKKQVVKKPAGPTPITYSHPTITINPTGDNDTSFKVEYTNKQYKSYNDQLIYDDSNTDTNANQLYLKGITYYNLANSKYRTAMTFTILVKNPSGSQNSYFNNADDKTYIASNNVAKKLVPAWSGYDYWDSDAVNIPATSQQVVDLTFVGTDDSTPADFSSFTFNYTPNDTIAVNLNF